MEKGKVSFKGILAGFFKVMGEVLGKYAVQEGSKIPAVQQEVERQKTFLSKEVLWKAFPFIAVGGLILFVVSKVK